jgi:hypothetical protein
MTTIDVVIYLLMFALSIIFLLMSFKYELFTVQTFIFNLLGWTSWFSLAGFHMVIASDSNLMSAVYLFLGIGLVQLVLSFASGIGTFINAGKKNRWTIVTNEEA